MVSPKTSDTGITVREVTSLSPWSYRPVVRGLICSRAPSASETEKNRVAILMADENNKNLALSPGHLLSEERVLRISPSSTTKNNESKCKIKIYNTKIRIATWNVRSLYIAGKLANVEAEMSRLNIDILGLSEVRWPGSGMQKTSNGVIYYSRGSDTNHRYRTAILVNNVVAESVAEFIPLNDRVMILKLQTSHRALNVIQVYAPTNDKTDAETEEFYSKIDEAMRLTKKGELTMVIGDYAKVGSGAEDDTVGQYGLGTKLRKYVQTVKTYPGADINSDHSPVVMDFRMRRLTKVRKARTPQKINIRQLQKPDMQTHVSSRLEDELKEIQRPEKTTVEIERTWDKIKTTITEIQVQDIGFPEVGRRKE
ncbi:craniofacial development protein 2-like [Temnothorax longispinosus]|uniref:craniofacial development protein 2-like n=1 Tax=Temnothorax longispinosus TaxID=300112 RepID=UPI003A996D80